MQRDAKIGLFILLVVVLLVAALFGRALLTPSPRKALPPPAPEVSSTPSWSTESQSPGSDLATPPASTTEPTPPPRPVEVPPELTSDSLARTGFPPRPAETAHHPWEASPGSSPSARESLSESRLPSSLTANSSITGPREVEPAFPRTTEPTTGGEHTYVLQEGDFLWAVSEKVYGHGKHWEKIADANRSLGDLRNLRIGTKLAIPEIPGLAIKTEHLSKLSSEESKVSRAPEKSTEETAAAATERTHVVKPGDSLYRLAEKYYGQGSEWKRIAEANRLQENSTLRVGMKLLIPAREKK